MNIFLSHSNADKELAHLIAEQIRVEMDLNNEAVFVSSEPETIASGDWFSSVMTYLDNAQIIILLITGSSAKSTWVSFEYGYFWGQKGKDKILFLRHPKVPVPSPLNNLQGKSILDIEEISVFFQTLCEKFGRTFQNKANLEVILQHAINLKIDTPEETMKELQKQIDYLASKSTGRNLVEEARARGYSI